MLTATSGEDLDHQECMLLVMIKKVGYIDIVNPWNNMLNRQPNLISGICLSLQ